MAVRKRIAMGASAGGVETLTRLVSGLPGGLDAAVLVTLHVSPTGSSVLPSILGRAGPLRATHARDGEELEPSRIYVAPPNHHLLVADGHLRLSHGPRENGHRPAVDPLLRTAGRAFGQDAIGVVLSGTLDDGAAGLLALRMAGGVGVVQDPDDALYPGMPRTAVVLARPEYVVPLDRLAPTLVELVARPPDPDPQPKSKEENVESQLEGTDPGSPEPVPEGTHTGLTCPECHGAMWEIRDGQLVQYRCRVGHAYGEQSYSAAQQASVEASLWAAMRALEERVALLRRISERIRDRGASASHFTERIAIGDAQAAVLRQLLEQVGALSHVEDGGEVDAA